MKQFFRLSAALALVVCSFHAVAQDWPAKPIKFVVPFSAGGANDLISLISSGELKRMLA